MLQRQMLRPTSSELVPLLLHLVDVSDFFNLFLLGGGEGGVRGAGRGGGATFYGTSQEGGRGSPGWVGAGGRGAGRVFAGNFGAVTFFFGAEMSTEQISVSQTRKKRLIPDFPKYCGNAGD